MPATHRRARATRIHQLAALLAAAFALSACGGGSGDDGAAAPAVPAEPTSPIPTPIPAPAPAADPDPAPAPAPAPEPAAPAAPTPPPSPLAIAATSPVDGDSGVSRVASLTATANAPVAADSLANGNVTLVGTLGPVDAVASADGSTVTLRPRAGTLVGDARYTVTWPASLQDTAGRSLGTARSVGFTTAAMAWAPRATALATVQDLNAVQTQVAAFDRQGRLLVAWTDTTASGTPVLKASWRSTADTAWAAAAAVSGAAFSARSPDLSCLDAGPCQLAWIQASSTTRATLQWSRLDTASGQWSAPIPVPMPVGGWDLSWLGSAVGADGRLTLLGWAGDRVVALRQDSAGTGWESPVTQVIVPAGARVARMAMDRSGNLTAVWIEALTTSERLLGSRYDAASRSWSSPVQLDDLVNPINGIDLVVDGSGSVTAAYVQGGMESRARTVRWDAGTGQWGSFTDLDPATTGNDGTPKLAVDSAGTVTAVWGAWPTSRWSRYDTGTRSWSAPGLLPAGIGQLGTHLTVDPAGNVTAAGGADSGITVTRYLTKDQAWTPLAEISTPPTGTALFASRALGIAVHLDGTVGVTWTQTNDMGSIRSSDQWVNVLR